MAMSAFEYNEDAGFSQNRSNFLCLCSSDDVSRRFPYGMLEFAASDTTSPLLRSLNR